MSLFLKLANGRHAKGFISCRYFCSFYEVKVNYLLISTPLTAKTALKALSVRQTPYPNRTTVVYPPSISIFPTQHSWLFTVITMTFPATRPCSRCMTRLQLSCSDPLSLTSDTSVQCDAIPAYMDIVVQVSARYLNSESHYLALSPAGSRLRRL